MSSPIARSEKDILIDAIRRRERFDLNRASDAVKDDEEVILEALKADYQNYRYASNRIRSIKSIALLAVEAKYSNIHWVSRDILLTSFADDPSFLSTLAKNARQGVLREAKKEMERRKTKY